MTSRQLLDAIGNAGDKYILEAASAAPRRRGKWVPVLIAAAGAAAILVLALLAGPKSETPPEGETEYNDNAATVPPDESAPEGEGPGNDEPDGDMLETALPPSPVYPEGDCYALACRLNGRTPEIDFPALFDAVLAEIDAEDPTIEDYVKANGEAYEELMGYGDETLFYSLCAIWPNYRELEDDAVTATDLAYHIVWERLHENGYFEHVLEGENRREDYVYLFRVIGPDYWRGGNDWLRDQPPEVYEVVRAIVSIPELRLANTVPTGEIVNEQVYLNAVCRGLVMEFFYGGTGVSGLPFQNETLPAPPEDVCNEFTHWELCQEEDASVVVTFTDSSTGAFKGRLRYIPTQAEIDGDPYARGTIEVEYPE